MKMNPKQYEKLVEQYSPNSHTLRHTFHAFWIGGLICVLGQLIMKG